MPISANDFLRAIGLSKKKKSEKEQAKDRLAGQTGGNAVQMSPYIPPPPPPPLAIGGPPSIAAMAPPPPPMAAPSMAPRGMSGQQWLDMALAALGGGPDRSAYVSPFEQAEQRARGANAAALPQIAQNYDRLRGELAATQQDTNAKAAQAQAAMAATQQQLQGQITQNAAPILADLASQGGTPALGGLLGAAQAQVGTGQAQLAQQGATQQQLAGNLQAATQASGDSRVADSRLAQGAATSNANNTLNSVLAQLDAKKAQALQAYAQDSQQYGSKVAQLRMEAMEREEARNDPLKQLELESRRLDLEDKMMDLDERRNPELATNRYRTALDEFHMRIPEKNPVAYSVLTEYLAEEPPLGALIAKIRGDAKNGKIKAKTGQSIDANWLIERAKELDALERAAEEEDERKKSTSKRRR